MEPKLLHILPALLTPAWLESWCWSMPPPPLLNCAKLLSRLLLLFIIIRLAVAAAFVRFRLVELRRLDEDADTDDASCMSRLCAEAELRMGALTGAFMLKELARSCCCSWASCCWCCCCCCCVWKGEWAVRCRTGKSDGSNVENVESVLTEILWKILF